MSRLKENFDLAIADRGLPCSVTVHPNEVKDMERILEDPIYCREGAPIRVIGSYDQIFECPMIEYFTELDDGGIRWDFKMTFPVRDWNWIR